MTEFIEYLGEAPHGSTFLTSHAILQGDPLWKREKLDVGQDLVWERDPLGPAVGFPGNQLLLATDDLPAGVADVLLKLPQYRLVTDDQPEPEPLEE